MRFLILLSAFLLSACVGSPPRQTEIARHDFGDPEGRWPVIGVAISRVDVRVAAWLDSPAQLYRLNYADPLRRQSYAENRWVAPPGELLERGLQRYILSGQAAGIASGCRLVLWLDELEQRFESPRSSLVVLDVRASLQPLRGDAILAQQEFHMVKVAPTPDARGGVQATRTAAAALAGDLNHWLGELSRTRSEIANLCKETKEK